MFNFGLSFFKGARARRWKRFFSIAIWSDYLNNQTYTHSHTQTMKESFFSSHRGQDREMQNITILKQDRLMIALIDVRDLFWNWIYSLRWPLTDLEWIHCVWIAAFFNTLFSKKIIVLCNKMSSLWTESMSFDLGNRLPIS